MDQDIAKALKAALDSVIRSLDAPMKLVADIDDKDLRRKVGRLASEVIAQIDYEILPYLHSKHPKLKAGE